MGPTGTGVLWGKTELLQDMYPFLYGGEMIEEVHITHSKFKSIPHKFEAGTPDIAGVIALKAAIEYLNNFSAGEILEHERRLWEALYLQLKDNKHIRIIGPKTTQNRTGVFAFHHSKIHPHDMSQFLAADNICIRAGNHCAMPLHEHLGFAASSRASFYIYNSIEDVDTLVKGIHKAEKLFLK